MTLFYIGVISFQKSFLWLRSLSQVAVMAWFFRKRIRILPGVDINLSKSGVGLSVGPNGAKVSIGKRGTYLNTSIPGTGLYNRTRLDASASGTRKTTERKPRLPADIPPAKTPSDRSSETPQPQPGFGAGMVTGIVLMLVAVGIVMIFF